MRGTGRACATPPRVLLLGLLGLGLAAALWLLSLGRGLHLLNLGKACGLERRNLHGVGQVVNHAVTLELRHS